MSEPIAVSELVGDLRFFEAIRKKNCGTIFEEISEYQPVQQPRATPEIEAVRRKRDGKQMRDEDYEKFWGQAENLALLECKQHTSRAKCGCKYHVEQYNRECYVRLCALERDCIAGDLIAELMAVKTKREQFERVIRSYPDRPLRIFIIPALAKNEPSARQTATQRRDEIAKTMDYLNQ